MAAQLRYIGTFPIDVLGARVTPGETLEVADDAVAADLLRRPEWEAAEASRRPGTQARAEDRDAG